jgi:flagellar basal body-associated protein FliL
MAEPKSDPKTEALISVALDEELSDAELNEALAEADPDFLKTVEEIGKDKNLSLSQIIITDTEQALNEERDAWEHSGKFGKTVFHVFPLVARLSLLLKRVKFVIFAFLLAEWIRTKNFFYFLATDGKKKVTGRIRAALDGFDETQRSFRYLNWKMKLAFFSILALLAGTGWFIHRSMTHGVIQTKTELFIPSMERLATEVFEYDPETETEPFYDNLRASSNIFLLPKMVVNLRKSAHSGSNPMGAFEFFLEAMAAEVSIELKDREVEMRDLVQRVVEEFTFDQVDSTDGKRAICEKLKKEINAQLTTGKLKKVWIKTVILKP